MQRQHKEILRQLKQGDLDRQVEILLGQPADVVDMSPPSTELRLVSSASTLCKALGHITEQELRRRREGKRISAELSAVDLALPAGIPPRHPTLSGYPIIEMDLPNQELETTLRGLGELGRTPAVPVIVVDHSSEPRTDEDCFSGGNTARGYPAVSRVTPIEDALLGAIDPLEPVPVELERDESSGDRPKNV